MRFQQLLTAICIIGSASAVVSAQRATPAADLKVPDGFKVELLRSASERDGSWVSVAMDDQGRLYISPQGAVPESSFAKDAKWGGLVRVTLDSHGQVSKWEKVPLPVGDSMGMLWAFNSLYVSGQGPEGRAIYRLRDTDGDDTLDDSVLFKKVPDGGGEHGAHAMVLGPDKKLYLTHGNSTPLVEGIAPDSPYRHYAEDDLLPRLKDPVATFFDKLKAPYGHILRTDENGTKWELFAGGLRNAYDIDFNEDGELFTFDSDMEWDVGLPWYRPTRILHVTSGAEFGFREGASKWPAYYPDSLPSVVDIGLGSPTGVKFGTNSNFPHRYKRALFAMDWTYGRILAIHMQPKGASYTADNPGASAFHQQGPHASKDVEVFLQGKGMPVADLEFGKDGAMYFLVGGRGTQAGLYRVSWDGSRLAREEAVETQFRTSEWSAARRVTESIFDSGIRRRVRATVVGAAETRPPIGPPSNYDNVVRGDLFNHGPRDTFWRLGSNDPSIRFASRVALEVQPFNVWRDTALGEADARTGLTALLGLARVGTKGDQAPILKALTKWPLDSLDEEWKLNKLRVIELCFVRHGRPNDDLVQLAIEKLSAQYPAKTFPLNRELSQLLVWLGAPDVVEKTLALLSSARDAAEQVWYANVLREATVWTPEQRERYFAWFSGASKFKGGNSAQKFIGSIRHVALAKVPEPDRAHLFALSEPRAEPILPIVPPRPFVQNWSVTDLAPDLEKVGSGRDLVRGKAMYAAAQCAACHLFAGEGGTIGPDLTAVASRYKRSDLVEAILDPNKGISEQYAVFHITKHNGKEEAVGMVVEENNDFVKVLVDPLRGTTQSIGKYLPPKRELLPISPMPPGLLNTLSKEEILDLLAYLETGAPAQ